MFKLISRIFLIVALLLPICGQAQEDPDAELLVNQRLEATTRYFKSNVSNDPSLVDTLIYVKRIYARHLEKIRKMTSHETNRQRMYVYAASIHWKRLGDVLSKEVLETYRNSFTREISGFTFCPVCKIKHSPDQLYCGFCGERLKED